jgi:glucans biosynthesis protein
MIWKCGAELRSAAALAVGVVLAVGFVSTAAFATTEAFGPTTVVDLARQLSRSAYVPPDKTLPSSISDLSYDDYQAMQFRRERALGRDANLPIWVELFHRGLLYEDRVDIAVVHDGLAESVPYSTDLFRFGELRKADPADGDIGFSGLRLLGPLNRPGSFDEFAVFQGASYFRSLASGQTYGLSARGLALRTDHPGDEEFPVFRKFWIERPNPQSAEIVVEALLDGPSVAGAYRFVLHPGSPTTMDVSATLFPRVDLVDVGLAPGTSMFAFDANGRRLDDYRPEVHDSDGLLIHENSGTYVWRPLANPREFSTSRYRDDHPLGFGLMQRTREFADYRDLWAHYETRPSLWIEPQGDWGEGEVTLVEIPTSSEFFDNIVAYWQPARPIAGGTEFSFAYRASWGGEPGGEAAVTVKETRSGQALSARPIPVRQFMIDFADPAAAVAATSSERDFRAILPAVQVAASAGSVAGLLLTPLPDGTGWRAGFQLDPHEARSIDLRLTLTFPDGRAAEVWTYRWTPA